VPATAVLTRDADSARPYAAALAPLGLDALAMPVTRTLDAAPADRAALAQALREPWDGVLVASARAVAPLVAAIAAGGAQLGRVVAVGPATAAALASHGIAAEVAAGDGVAAAAALVAAGCRRVLVPRAAGGRDEPIDRLRQSGVDVRAIDVYRTVAAPDDDQLAPGLDAILAGRAAVIALFAPSQVAALLDLLATRGAAPTALSSTVIAAIGATTASALATRGIVASAVADRPDPAAMAHAVSAVYPVRR
jgi:uroporphyrinogen-III synthase